MKTNGTCPHYWKIKKSDVFKCDKRRIIFNTISKYPGSSMYELRKKLSVGIGTLRYHLMVLKYYGYIKNRKMGNRHNYYPKKIEMMEKNNVVLLKDGNMFILNFNEELKDVFSLPNLDLNFPHFHCTERIPLKKTEKIIIKHLLQHSTLNQKDLSQLSGLSQQTISYNIKKLENKNISHYHIINGTKYYSIDHNSIDIILP